jgi:hypothetical protein
MPTNINIISSNFFLYDKSIAGGFCPTTPLKQAQLNTVFSGIEEMDQVGFEPTTSTAAAAFFAVPI